MAVRRDSPTAEGHAHAQVAQRRLEGLGPEHDVVAVNRLDDITLICAPLLRKIDLDLEVRALLLLLLVMVVMVMVVMMVLLLL